MADDFNPYHVWLGIPPDEQPANHYRLLSLRLFESIADVIDNAADRQMAHLRTIQVGKHVDQSQRLLNEVAAARVCLLDPKKRAAYDQQLRAKLAAALPASASGAELPAAGGSAIQRQPPRRTTGPVPASPAANIPTAAPLPQQRVDPWDNLLGQPDVKSKSGAGGKSVKSAAAKRGANNRNMMIGIGVAVALVALAGIGLLLLNGSSSDGTLVFDWPAAYRTDTNVSIDGVSQAVPASGPWEYRYPAGSHRIVAEHLAYKLDTHLDLAAGSQQSVPPDWKPKAMLVLSWPLGLRSGAELKIDGRAQTISQRDPMEVPVEPGRRTIVITRRGYDPIHTTVTVAADGRELVSIAAPPTTAKLVFDWPAAERKNSELIVDGKTQSVVAESNSAPFEITLPPGRHVVHITRAGFEPFNQAIDLSAGTESAVKPTWTPETKIATAPTTTETPVQVETTAPQPAKKLPVPSAAEQEKIAKQLNEVYKTSQPGPKDPAKAEELYDVAAKDGSPPAERYMLLMKGAEIAAAAGDLNLSLQGIDTLGVDYDIDVLAAKQKQVDKFLAAAKTEQLADATPAVEQLIDQAAAADRYDIAIASSTTASNAVAKLQAATRKEAEKWLSRRRRELRLLEPIYASAKKSQATLEKTPTDPEANLTVGRWRCFYKGDWDGGLPLLVNGGEDKLRALAQRELKAPTGADQQVELADAWLDFSEKQEQIARRQIKARAVYWYKKAVPGLTGLAKDKAEKRLAAASATDELDCAVKEYALEAGKPSVQLIRSNSGFCCLSSVSGRFEGYGEGIGVHVGTNGFWSLEMHSGGDPLMARAISIEPVGPMVFKSRVKEYQWRNGAPPIKMLRKSVGICFLSAIEGRFGGGGEEVRVRLEEDGYWYLEGRSGQKELGARAIGLEWSTPGDYSVDAEEHSWSFGEPPVKLSKKHQGFALLSSVCGRLGGGGEEARVYFGDDGIWYLAGRSGQHDLRVGDNLRLPKAMTKSTTAARLAQWTAIRRTRALRLSPVAARARTENSRTRTTRGW